MLVKGLAVVLLAGLSVALGAAFALPGRAKKDVASCPVFDDGPTPGIAPGESKSEGQDAEPRPSVGQKPTGDDSPARSFPPVAFDVPKVAPRLPAAGFDLTRTIDREVRSRLDSSKLPASPVSGDAEFVRRAHLDLVGRIPSKERVVAFLDDADPEKRTKLIDELLASPDFGRHLARIWADLLIKRDFDTNKNLKSAAFVTWLAEQINKGVGWDRIVSEMLTATGPEASTPQTFFVSANQDNKQPSPSKLTGSVGNLFLGVQLQCAECHQHPHTSKWGMNDFWGVAAFFGHTRMERDGGAKNKKMNGPATIKEVASVKAPTGKAAKKAGPAVPSGLSINIPDPNDPRKVVRSAKGKFFESGQPVPTGGVPYRPALAKWLVAKENPYFARAAVNRFWSHLFARGLVNPIDDMNPDNEPSHPELLKALASSFRESNHDVKALFRAVCNSEPYQRTSRPLPDNRDDEKLYSHMPVKVVDARVMLDSLAVVTGQRSSEKAGSGKQAERSVAGTGGDPVVRFFDTREADDDATEYSYGIPQILRLMNSNLTASTNAIASRLASQHRGDHPAALDALFLMALSRKPTAGEKQRMTSHVEKSKDATQGYAGVLWALLNSAEFVSNH